MEQPWRVGFFVAVAAGSMVVAACGGGGDDTGATAGPDTTVAASGRAPTAPERDAVGAAGDAFGDALNAGSDAGEAEPLPSADTEAEADAGAGPGEPLDVGPSSSSGGACTSGAPGGASGAAEFVADIDGDGEDDAAWVDGRVVHVATASGGGGTHTTVLDGAGLTLLVADVDERGPVELLVSDGALAELLTFTDCTLQPVLDWEGGPFRFDLTGEYGTGVGCVDVDGRRELVGLNVEGDDGTTVSWERTVIGLDGAQASRGASDSGTFRHPDQDEAIAMLHTITCHDLLIDEDGVPAS
jgi:hypothetical protein